MFGDLEKLYTYKKSDGERFSAFCFFCVRERQIRRDPNLGHKIMPQKNNEAKDRKTRHNKVPEKTQKMGGGNKKCPNA
jgi:hypothetical protein